MVPRPRTRSSIDREVDMFVQVIKAQTTDPAAAKAAVEKWTHDVAPDASGWLGSTGGVTDDGTLIALVRFASEEDAQRNSERPEQDAWWTEFSGLLTGDVSFANSTDVDVDTVGDPDRAGFVQVMQGHTSNPERARELMDNDSPDWASFRPDILGSIIVNHDGGDWTMAIYFTSEAEAREGESKEPPADMKETMEELDSLNDGPMSFYDLREPWLHSPH
jgi:hypothetical protein